MIEARRISVRGIVQGVGFRPFVFRLAERHGLAGWVLNGERGVEIHAKGARTRWPRSNSTLLAAPPPAARIASCEARTGAPEGHAGFAIRASAGAGAPTVRVSPDLPVCAACLAELGDPADRRAGYPYINCTDCGPRFSIVLGLPYDRPRTTMRDWPLCADCAREYDDPRDRRFHAQPVACPACGPRFRLRARRRERRRARQPARSPRPRPRWRPARSSPRRGSGATTSRATPGSPAAVAALRERKFRKERPFAVMVRDLAGRARWSSSTPEAGPAALEPAAADRARAGAGSSCPRSRPGTASWA